MPVNPTSVEAASPIDFSNKRILIVGCTGYVGSNLIPALRAHLPGALLFGTSRGEPSSSLLEQLDGHTRLDLTDAEQVDNAVAALRPDVTVHLASPRAGDLAHLLHLYVTGLANLLRAVREHALPSALTLVVGSSAEIGYCLPTDLPLAESAPCRPIDDYGIAKQTQALLAQAAGVRYLQPVIRVRLFNLLGPGLPASLLPGRCVRLLAQHARGSRTGPIEFGNLSTQRDYTDVRDACEAMALAMRFGSPGRLYHVGTGQSLSGTEIVQGLINAGSRQLPAVAFSEADGDPPYLPIQRADSTLARQELGWQPRISLQQAFADMWEQALSEEDGGVGRVPVRRESHG